MYCIRCGKQLPTDALFCAYCGTSLRGNAAASVTAEQWEYCEITPKRGLTWFDWAFEAVATGPSGTRVVGKIASGKDHLPVRINRDRVENLVNRLIKDGWEPQPKGSGWYAHRFRRRSPS